MNDKDLIRITQLAFSYLRKSNPCASVPDVEDAISRALIRYLEKFGSLNSLTTAWLITAASRKLVDEFRKRHRNVSLDTLYDKDAVEDSNQVLVDLGDDNPDLRPITQELLFPWLETEDSDEAA